MFYFKLSILYFLSLDGKNNFVFEFRQWFHKNGSLLEF